MFLFNSSMLAWAEKEGAVTTFIVILVVYAICALVTGAVEALIDLDQHQPRTSTWWIVFLAMQTAPFDLVLMPMGLGIGRHRITRYRDRHSSKFAEIKVVKAALKAHPGWTEVFSPAYDEYKGLENRLAELREYDYRQHQKARREALRPLIQEAISPPPDDE